MVGTEQKIRKEEIPNILFCDAMLSKITPNYNNYLIEPPSAIMRKNHPAHKLKHTDLCNHLNNMLINSTIDTLKNTDTQTHF